MYILLPEVRACLMLLARHHGPAMKRSPRHALAIARLCTQLIRLCTGGSKTIIKAFGMPLHARQTPPRDKIGHSTACATTSTSLSSPTSESCALPRANRRGGGWRPLMRRQTARALQSQSRQAAAQCLCCSGTREGAKIKLATSMTSVRRHWTAHPVEKRHERILRASNMTGSMPHHRAVPTGLKQNWLLMRRAGCQS